MGVRVLGCDVDNDDRTAVDESSRDGERCLALAWCPSRLAPRPFDGLRPFGTREGRKGFAVQVKQGASAGEHVDT